MKFELGKTYVVRDSFVTPVVNGHEIAGQTVVPLDDGNTFTVKDTSSGGWFVASMDHNLAFESQERPGTAFYWSGDIYVRDDAHRELVKEKS